MRESSIGSQGTKKASDGGVGTAKEEEVYVETIKRRWARNSGGAKENW